MTDEERREHIKQRYGVDLSEPFTMTVFLDETVQWGPVTIMFAWLASLYAEECGDSEPGEAYRIAQARVPMLTYDDWAMFMLMVRQWGALLSREIPKENHVYLLDEFKGHDDYERLLYLEAISAGSCCTLAGALLANIEAYMGAHGDQPDTIHPSVELTMTSLREMFTMRDDWLKRLRDMRLADQAPLPFDETIGASVPIQTQQRATATARVISEAAQATGSDADVSRIFDRAREAIGLSPDDLAPTRGAKAKRKRPAKASV